MQNLEELCYVLEDMVEPIVDKGDISPTELDNIYKAVKTMYYIKTMDAMKEYGNSYAGSYGRSYEGSYANRGYSRNSYDGRMGMDRDNDGRYSERRYSYRGNSNRGYSRDDYRED